MRQAAEAIAVITPFLLLIAYGTGALPDLFGKPEPATPPAQARPAAMPYRIGSILVVPAGGVKCERRLFDNMTGRLVADGFFDCPFVQPQELPTSAQPASTRDRMRAVLKGFKK